MNQFSFLAIALLLASVAYGQKSQSNTPAPGKTKAPTETDKKFAKQAAVGDAAEVQLGQMAQAKGSDDAVKKFGERMVTDHSKADEQLKQIADKQHIALPAELDAPHQAEKSRLSILTGSAFDRAYALEMVQDHQKTIQKFQQEATGGGDPELKDFATKTLPILKEHLSLAQQMQQKVEGKP